MGPWATEALPEAAAAAAATAAAAAAAATTAAAAAAQAQRGRVCGAGGLALGFFCQEVKLFLFNLK